MRIWPLPDIDKTLLHNMSRTGFQFAPLDDVPGMIGLSKEGSEDMGEDPIMIKQNVTVPSDIPPAKKYPSFVQVDRDLLYGVERYDQ